jgi:hypothetical protein
MKTKIFVLTGLFLLIYNASATNYYISNNGNDNNNGHSKQSAWKTIAKVNATALYAGDSVLFQRGGTWREELLIQYSGTEQSYIVYSAYGTGHKPRILGSDRSDAWTEIQSNIWQSTSVLAAPRQRTGNATTNHPASIFFGEKDGSITWGNMENIHLNSEGAPTDICECTRDNGFALLDKEHDWCWEANHIYVFSTQNPAERYDFIEVPQRVSAIKMESHNAQQYIKIENLELMFALKYGFDGGWPMAYEKRGLQIKYCHIGYMGTKGAASAIGLQVWHSDMLIQGNDIHDCGRRNISYNVYADTRTSSLVFENVVFDGNNLHNGYHTTGVDIYGGYSDEFRNFVIKNNYIWDNPEDDPANQPNDFTSMGTYLASGNATFDGFKVYNNVFSFIKQKHIVADNLKNSFVVNNTFYGMNLRAGGSGYRAMISVSADPENFVIDNNIFYGNVKDEYVLSAVTFSDDSHLGTSMNNNLFYQEDPSQRIVTINVSGNSYRMAQWEEYKSGTGWDADSPAPSNPLFMNAPDDLSLSPNSPAINAAVYYPEITTDILGIRRNPTPCIGAYEYNGLSGMRDTDNNTDLFVIYPNPTNGIIGFAGKSNKWIENITILDITGKTILERTDMHQNQVIDISDFEKGMYIVKLKTGKETIAVKIVKE